MIMDEKKWNKEVVAKIDIVPDDAAYYEKLAVKPGFDFLYALVNSDSVHLAGLRLFVPDTLYFNYNSFMIKSDSQGRLHIKQAPKSRDFLESLESSTAYDIVKNWSEPATVLRKATGHPCYQTVNLLNWKQTYEHIREGPSNRTYIQKYQKSFGESVTLYRACVYPEDMVNAKGSGKYNYCYALTNKIPFKSNIEENLRLLEEFEQQLEDDEGETKEAAKKPPKLNNRFENRYLICPFEVGSFDVYTYMQKTMGLIEKEAYKIFNFMERAFEMRLLNCVTDWIRDEQGIYWFIGLKSFKLREESYFSKTTKPSAFDRELLALNVNKKVVKSKLEVV